MTTGIEQKTGRFLDRGNDDDDDDTCAEQVTSRCGSDDGGVRWLVEKRECLRGFVFLVVVVADE